MASEKLTQGGKPYGLRNGQAEIFLFSNLASLSLEQK